MSKFIDLNTFADGALAEAVNNEVSSVMANLRDLNTDPKAKRKVTITISFKTDDKREVIDAAVTSKSTYAPRRAIESKVMIGYQDGKLVGSELKSGIVGQTFIDKDGDVAQDDGTKVIDMRQKTGGNQ